MFSEFGIKFSLFVYIYDCVETHLWKHTHIFTEEYDVFHRP